MVEMWVAASESVIDFDGTQTTNCGSSRGEFLTD
jgi:hypothetical protein